VLSAPVVLSFLCHDAAPPEVIDHIREALGLGKSIRAQHVSGVTLLRHKAKVLEYLRVQSFYGADAVAGTERLALEAAELLDQRSDIINAMIEGLIMVRYELPAFSTLEDLAERAHVAVQTRIFESVSGRIGDAHRENLKALLQTDKFEQRQSEYNRLKKSAKRPTRKHLETLVDHLEWLESIPGWRVFEEFRTPRCVISPDRRWSRCIGTEGVWRSQALHADGCSDPPHAGSRPGSAG
jgi:hypothetical protein